MVSFGTIWKYLTLTGTIWAQFSIEIQSSCHKLLVFSRKLIEHSNFINCFVLNIICSLIAEHIKPAFPQTNRLHTIDSSNTDSQSEWMSDRIYWLTSSMIILKRRLSKIQVGGSMNPSKGHRDKDFAALDELIKEITVNAYGNDEKTMGLSAGFRGQCHPAGRRIRHRRAGLDSRDRLRRQRTSRIDGNMRREDDSEHVVATSDVVFPERSSGARHVAAYRRWLGVEPYPVQVKAPSHRRRRHKATTDDLDLSAPVELVALAVKERATRCRLLGSERVITLRASRLWDVVPGEIVTVKPRKQWRFAGHPYLSGEIESTRLDVATLGLVPLQLEDMGMWTPKSTTGARKTSRSRSGPSRSSPADRVPSSRWSRCCPEPTLLIRSLDPITESNDLKDVGDRQQAMRILMELCSLTCVASMPMHTSAISSSIALRKTPSATLRSACASGS